MEEVKVCRICGEGKTLDNFYFRKDNQTYRGECKECHSKIGKCHRENNAEKIKAQRKQYRDGNKELVKEQKKRDREKHKDKRNKKSREWVIANKEHVQEREAKRYVENREEILQ